MRTLRQRRCPVESAPLRRVVRLSAQKRRWFAGLLGLIILLACAALIEGSGRGMYRDELKYVRDVDHRMGANSSDTNADGIRSQYEADAFPPEDFNLIFLGDSFVYGYCLDRDQAVPQLLEALLRRARPDARINVANFGWISSSPYLSLRLLKDLGAKYHPDLVLLGLDLTDYYEDSRNKYLLERPYPIYQLLGLCPGTVLLLRNSLIACKQNPYMDQLYERIFHLPTKRFAIVAQPLERSLANCRVLGETFNQLNEYAREQLGAPFMLVAFPRSFQYTRRECPRHWEANQYEVLGPYALEPFKWIDRLRQEVKYPVISLLADFQQTKQFPLFMPDDPHWNEAGAQFVAQKIFEILKQKGMVPPLAGETTEPTGAIKPLAMARSGRMDLFQPLE